ncbi:MAG: hypothetical protein ACLFQV_08925 [Vulcanimicrobiota bacterium]
MSKIINREEIAFNSTSYVDPNSRVFHWNDKIYRAVVPEMAEFYRKTISTDWFQKLIKKGELIDTRVTDFELEGFDMVLEHRKLETITYCPEWPAFLLKKAAVLTLELCLELLEYDLTLQDAYPWNVQFEGINPVFIDVGSICPFPNNKYLWIPYTQFCNFFLFPLFLYDAGINEPTRRMLFDYLNGISMETCGKLLPSSYRFIKPEILSRIDIPNMMNKMFVNPDTEKKVTTSFSDIPSHAMKNIRRNFFKGLLKTVKNLKIKKGKTVWSDYEQGQKSFEKPDKWTIKQKKVKEILEKLQPETVMDIAANQGWFSILASRSGARVLAFDTDDGAINKLCHKIEETKNQVTPLIMNALNPTPSFGWCLKQFPSAFERISAQMTFAFALIHHLVFSQWQSFDRIVETMDNFTEKWLLIEFVPKDDEKSQILLRRKEDSFDWYTLENFEKSLRKVYKEIEIFDSHPTGRKLLLCTK